MSRTWIMFSSATGLDKHYDCWTEVPIPHPWEEGNMICGYHRHLDDKRCEDCAKRRVPDNALKEVQASWARRWEL